MIAHLVGWTLTATDDAERDAAAEAIRDALESLVGVVPGLLELTVRRNAVDVDGNSDIALRSRFVDERALRDYIVHPAHQAAVRVVRAHTSGRWAIDLAD
ncbi:MAG: Dabb family protein [Microbacteriaceae bacterium]